MFFLSQIVVVYFFLFIIFSISESYKDGQVNRNFLPKCQYTQTAHDQTLRFDNRRRRKRFVLFPEFQLWINDWRYLARPTEFSFWIANFYPQRIDTDLVRIYIHRIVRDINQVIGHRIRSVSEAASPEQANFHYQFFNYERCPTEDTSAVTNGVQIMEPMLIYPAEVVKKSRYRAHGGITLNHGDNTTTSHVKFNIHHSFLFHKDYQYEPVVYTCNSDESQCSIDLYAVMLHETLHGFGIEHTERHLPNKNMRAVMHLFASRIMCHDDIRAIRMVYDLPVKRQNAKFDDTCRRDFPLSTREQILRDIRQWLILIGLLIGPSLSLIVFLVTVMYILMKRRCSRRSHSRQKKITLPSHDSPRHRPKQPKSKTNAFLWHDDYLNG